MTKTFSTIWWVFSLDKYPTRGGEKQLNTIIKINNIIKCIMLLFIKF